MRFKSPEKEFSADDIEAVLCDDNYDAPEMDEEIKYFRTRFYRDFMARFDIEDTVEQRDKILTFLSSRHPTLIQALRNMKRKNKL